MKKINQKEDLKSRRDFFKAAAKGILPIFGLTILGQTIITSCDKLDDITGCSDCSGGCEDSCENGCSGTCKSGCNTGCSGTCKGGCFRACSSGCKLASKK